MTEHPAGAPSPSIFRTFSSHPHLLGQFIRREIASQTRGSVLGMLWWVLNPLLMLALYTVVFGLVMGGHFRGVEDPGPFSYPLGIFVGLSVLGLVTETLNQSASTVLSQPNLVHKVRFPTEILAIAKVGAAGVRSLISLALALTGIALIGPGLDWHALLLPVVLLPLGCMALGIGWLLSALGVYLRDSQHLVLFVSSVIFYSSAVFYAAASVPEPIMDYLRFNPILHAVEEARSILLWHQAVNWTGVAYLYVWGLGLLLLGHSVFQRLKDGFADVL